MPDFTDKVPEFGPDFTGAWHMAGHFVGDSMMGAMLEQAQEQGGVAVPVDAIMSAVAAMGFYLGAVWRTNNPRADLKLPDPGVLLHEMLLNHIMDEDNPG